MAILNVGIGFMMLIAGRPVYAVFVGGMGYLLANFLIGELGFIPSNWNSITFPLLAAFIGALAAFIIKHWIVRLTCFLAGIYLVYDLPATLDAAGKWDSWILVLAVGLLCFILSIIWFDYAVMIISTLVAATMIIKSIHFGILDIGAMFFILVILGVLTQYLIWQYWQTSPE